MGEVAIIVIASWAAGSTAVVGGAIAWGIGGKGAGTKREITHGVIAFGGGILIAAVAFALLPQGMAVLSPGILGGAFCAGGCLFGIMYLIFQDIAPQAKMKRHWIPALGAVLGFAVGMIGKQLLG